MFAIVHPPSDVQDGNAGSCRALAQYLDKEAGEGLRFFPIPSRTFLSSK